MTNETYQLIVSSIINETWDDMSVSINEERIQTDDSIFGC